MDGVDPLLSTTLGRPQPHHLQGKTQTSMHQAWSHTNCDAMDGVVHMPPWCRGGGVPPWMPSSWLSAMDDAMDGVVRRGQEQERWRADATRRGERPNGSHETKTTIGHADAR